MSTSGPPVARGRPRRAARLVLVLLAALHVGSVRAAEVLAAVAANFTDAASELQRRFETARPHTLTLTTGSTGKLYAQIAAGAPFDVLLAADQARPRRLEADGLAVPGSRFTYAVGRLTLWSADPGRLTGDGREVLAAGHFRALAMANPALAPYGVAARQVLRALGLEAALRERIVMGENIGQTYALVATGNAELGFVALSYVLSPRNTTPGSRWDVPRDLYDPIRQDAVLLARAKDNPGARELMDFLRGAPARVIIREFGYGVE